MTINFSIYMQGCDASILIDPNSTRQSEKNAGPNLTVREYDLIDEAKKELESACPSKVSCADIIALATREAVFLAGGPFYQVPTGRRDGLVSNPDEVNLPGPTSSVPQAFQSFRAKNMSMDDMVILLSAHTVGVAHCSFFLDRIGNSPDRTMDPALVFKLRKICGAANASNPDPTAFLDQGTSFTVDNEYLKQINWFGRGVLKIDQELANDRLSRGFVLRYAWNSNMFRARFAQAMVKMGGIEVLVGNAGEIRTNCRKFNPKK